MNSIWSSSQYYAYVALVVVHSCHANIETGGLKTPGQPGLHGNTLSHVQNLMFLWEYQYMLALD